MNLTASIARAGPGQREQQGIVLEDPGCVAKTYPDYFTDLERLRR